MSRVEEVLAFWMGDSASSPERAEARKSFWFAPDPEVDRDVATRFAADVDRAATGACERWAEDPRGRLALVIVLDQFPRNLHRGTAEAFGHDAAALAVARAGVESGQCDDFGVVDRAFLLMPYQHVEDLALQRESVALTRQMVEQAPAEWRAVAEGFAGYAREHCEIVERFGRFPHRNRLLDRESTEEERVYLEQGAPDFGQPSGPTDG